MVVKLTKEEILKRLEDYGGYLRELECLKSSVEAFLLETRRKCPHEWEYLPDPSGNNDSSYVCRTCELFSKYGPDLCETSSGKKHTYNLDCRCIYCGKDKPKADKCSETYLKDV